MSAAKIVEGIVTNPPALEELVQLIWEDTRKEKGIDASVTVVRHEIKAHGSVYSGPVYLSDGTYFDFEAILMGIIDMPEGGPHGTIH